MTIAAFIGATILMFLLLDFLDGPSHWEWPFGLDAEFTPAAAFSSLILISAALVAVLGGGRYVRPDAARIGVGLLFAFMALDEALTVHERIESWAGIDWQVLYAPIFLVCGVAWFLMLLRDLNMGSASMLWVVGAGFWALSQGLEYFQWQGDSLLPQHTWTFYLEEGFEMAGSACWLLALLIEARVIDKRTADPQVQALAEHA